MSLVKVGDFQDHATIHDTVRNVKHILSDGHYQIMENSNIVIEFDHFQGKISKIHITQRSVRITRSKRKGANYTITGSGKDD